MSMVEWISHEKKDSLILFVHGLNGGLETWNFNKEISFPKLLAEDEDISNVFDIACFNYFTKFTQTYAKTSGFLARIFFKKNKLERNLPTDEIAELLYTEIRVTLSDYSRIRVEFYSNGQDINDPDYDKKSLRAKVGLVFQYPEHQLFETDCFKDVCFGPKNLGLSQKEVELRAYEALKQVGFDDDYFYQSPFDLSGGQKRRVAIAGVLAMKPEVLILDEPTAGLDPKGREDILNLISRLHQEMGITIILVSHSMDDVANYVQRIIVMNKGRVAFDDEPKEVFRH